MRFDAPLGRFRDNQDSANNDSMAEDEHREFGLGLFVVFRNSMGQVEVLGFRCILIHVQTCYILRVVPEINLPR